MRLKFLVLLLISFALICDVSLAAKDRKKNKNKNRHEDTTEDDEGRREHGGLSVAEDKKKETKDRVMDVVERGEERKDRHEKKEESSEEDDKDKKEEKNSTEIVIPKGRFRRHHHHSEHLRHRRQDHSLKKTSEINDGAQTPLDAKPSQDHQCGPNCEHRKRHRRQENSLKRTSEINDGAQKPLDAKPSQDHQCGVNCKHNKRSADMVEDFDNADGVFEYEEEIPGTALIRTRRAKGGMKDIGHRAATHPHGNKRAGLKAGRRRGQNSAANAKIRKEKASRNRRVPTDHTGIYASDSLLEKEIREYYRQYNEPRTVEYHGKVRSERSVAPEELDRKKEHSKYTKKEDPTIVAADAATITEI